MDGSVPQIDSPTAQTTRPRKLALVIHALYGGGAERLMSQLASRWSQAGHQVHLITLAAIDTDKYSVDSQVVRHGLDLLSHSRNPFSALVANWKRVRGLRDKLRELQPDWMLSFCDRTNIVALTAALPLSLPKWIAEHSDPQQQVLGLFWEAWRQWSYRALARQPEGGCVVLTPAIAEHFAARFPGLQIAVIPPAISVYQCTNTLIHDARSGDSRQLLFLGRLSQEKNLPELLKAWRELAKVFPNWRLAIAGDGPERERLRSISQQLSLERVEFLGWVADPQPLLAGSDLFILPSKYEGFPVALLEAMGSGVACVSTPCSSALDQLASAGALLVCQSSQADAIASTLAKLMADEARRLAAAQRGRELAKNYAWDVIGLQWDQVL